MRAKIRDIGFAPDTIVVGVDVFFEKGEFGYENCCRCARLSRY